MALLAFLADGHTHAKGKFNKNVAAGFKIEMRLFNVRTQQTAYGREYSGSNARLFAHTISDEVHKSQRALNGLARSKLTFDSDRDGERKPDPTTGPVPRAPGRYRHVVGRRRLVPGSESTKLG